MGEDCTRTNVEPHFVATSLTPTKWKHNPRAAALEWFISEFLERAASREGSAREAADGGSASHSSRSFFSAWRRGTKMRPALREDVSGMLQKVGGIEVALAAAAGEVGEALARGFAELSGRWIEFRWLLGEVQGQLVEVQAHQAETLALYRASLTRVMARARKRQRSIARLTQFWVTTMPTFS
jgi:hypothetical protein